MTDFPGCPVVKTLLSNAGAVSSIPGWGSKIPHVMQGSQKKKKQQHKSFGLEIYWGKGALVLQFVNYS